MQIPNKLTFNVANCTPNALNEMTSDVTFLTPDALMTYCATRLRGLDTQVQTAFAKQQQANADSTVLSALSQDLSVPAKDLDLSSGGMDCAKSAITKLQDAAAKIQDPQAKQALLDAANQIQGRIDAYNNDNSQSTLDVTDFTSMTTGAVSSIQKDLNSGTELSMIQLQSLMSQRQQAISVCTNLVQALGDQANKIADNVGK